MLTLLHSAACVYVVGWIITSALYYASNRACKKAGLPSEPMGKIITFGMAWPVVLAHMIFLVCLFLAIMHMSRR